MKPWMKIAAPIVGICLILVICLTVGLRSCKSETDETTAPTGTEASTTPTVDPAALYASACDELTTRSDLMISYDLQQQRTVGSESYSDSVVGTAAYAGQNTENLKAKITETVTYGDYETQLTRSYLSGNGYCLVNDCSFVCELTAGEFAAGEIPAALLDASLYTSITLEANEKTTTVYFYDPIGLESWLCSTEGVELITAHGSAVLDANGALAGSSYHAEYAVSNASYTVDVSTAVTAPASSGLENEELAVPENSIPVNDLSIPKMLLQTVGNVYSTKAMTVSYTDTLYSAAFAVIRSQQSDFNTYGTGEDFMCSMSTQVSVTDYTGTSTANSQSISYIDGVYSNTTNGGQSSTTNDVTAEEVRTTCEDSILSSLIEFSCIKSAEMSISGDFICIEFDGNGTFADSICASIYTLLGVNLDAYAESYATDYSGGYLYINKYTGLPTALGMNLSRSHTISGVPYQMTYQLDQTMALDSSSAYQSITGQAEPDVATEKAATPLFYKVTGADGKTMWLLGTIHVGDARTGSLPAQILDAFNASDALAVEFDSIAFEKSLLEDPALQAEVSNAYYYTDGKTLSQHLSKDLYNRLSDVIMASGRNSINAPYMKTIIWTSLIENFYLEQGSYLAAGKGVDTRLLTLATAQSKPIHEIESGLSQIQMLSGFSNDLQAILLDEALTTGLTGYCCGVEELYEMWCQGDEAALTAYIADDKPALTDDELELYEEYEKAMSTDRNKLMLKAAKNYLESDETVFCAVGLAHLLGEDGLVQTLRDAGYTVELVTYE